MFADRIADPKQIHNRVGLYPELVDQVRRAHKFVLSRPFAFAADALSERPDDLLKLPPFCRREFGRSHGHVEAECSATQAGQAALLRLSPC
jgi:hypothetical protein